MQARKGPARKLWRVGITKRLVWHPQRRLGVLNLECQVCSPRNISEELLKKKEEKI